MLRKKPTEQKLSKKSCEQEETSLETSQLFSNTSVD